MDKILLADANYIELSSSLLEDPLVLMGKPVGVMGIHLAVRRILSSMGSQPVDHGNIDGFIETCGLIISPDGSSL